MCHSCSQFNLSLNTGKVLACTGMCRFMISVEVNCELLLCSSLCQCIQHELTIAEAGFIPIEIVTLSFTLNKITCDTHCKGV